MPSCPHLASCLPGSEAIEPLSFETMLEVLPVGAMTRDLRTFTIDDANTCAIRLLHAIRDSLGIGPDRIVGTAIDVFHEQPGSRRGPLSDPASPPHRAQVALGPAALDLRAPAVTGTEGETLGPMLPWSVIARQAAAEARIHQLAHYDTLTGLANRATFREHLEAALDRAQPRLGLLFIDLDGFKLVNDANGHLVGDALLQRVAERLRERCGAPDVTVARLGGDEFAILIQDGDGAAATRLAGDLVETLVEPFHVADERRLQVGASIGVAVAPLHGSDSETLLSRADMALYAAKAAGKNTFRLFEPELERRMTQRVRLEATLRRALECEDELFLFYQPITDIRTGRVTAREGLIRWHHPERSWIPPGDFIPIAEESGLIEELGAWVLQRACTDAMGWEDGARIAVNVSPRQLGSGRLTQAVLSALVASGLPPQRLELEVTESALLSEHVDCLGELRRIRGFGVRIALDDFGTGFSSLAHLRAFPFDKIKIDGSFVRDATSRPDCAAIVGVVADLGRRLGVTTVAEGVETEAHLALVTAEGCSEVQGYLLGRPQPHPRDAERVAQLSARPAPGTVGDEGCRAAA